MPFKLGEGEAEEASSFEVHSVASSRSRTLNHGSQKILRGGTLRTGSARSRENGNLMRQGGKTPFARFPCGSCVAGAWCWNM